MSENKKDFTYFDKNAKEIDNDKLAWAKKFGNNYYIKCCNGRIVDPNDLMSKDGKFGPDWKKVQKESFDFYISFLKTKKVYFLRGAQKIV